LCFDVQDTGTGIPEDKLDQLWESFSQVQSEGLRRGVEGLGLGLALVKFVVRAHGGFAWVESNIGQGSVFGFQVPLRGPRYPLEPTTAPRHIQR
jgi:signal transduction histidine kinase